MTSSLLRGNHGYSEHLRSPGYGISWRSCAMHVTSRIVMGPRESLVQSESVTCGCAAVSADLGHASGRLRDALVGLCDWTIELCDAAQDAEILSRWWAGVRRHAGLDRHSRLATNIDAAIVSVKVWVFTAHIRLLLRYVQRIRSLGGFSGSYCEFRW